MTSRRIRALSAILVISSLAAATPARAGNICETDPEMSWASWFAHWTGACKGEL